MRIESKEEFLNEIDECKDNVKKFREHGMCTMFDDAVRGDGFFYHHCANHCVPKIVRVTLNQLNCSVGVWTTQVFYHRNKQRKHICERKTNGEGNGCKQVLKELNYRFMRS